MLVVGQLDQYRVPDEIADVVVVTGVGGDDEGGGDGAGEVSE